MSQRLLLFKFSTYSIFFFFFELQEVHILHTFDNDFYGEKMKIIVLDYIRQEKDFTSIGKIVY